VTDDQPTETLAGPPAGPEAGPPPAPGGETWIADAIVEKIAAAAAREVDGVDDLRGGGPRRGWIRASDRSAGGARVAIHEGVATIVLRLVVRHGVAIVDVVDAVRARVIERVEFATGMTVARVDIGVLDVVAPPAADAPAPPEATGPAGDPLPAGA